MGLSDRLKDLRKQAETTVAEHKDQITGAVGSLGAAANDRTKGKYADKIAKVGDRVTSAVGKVGIDGQPAQQHSPFPPADPAKTAPAGDTAPPSSDPASHNAPDFQ